MFSCFNELLCKMKEYIFLNKRGITLAEIVVALGIFVILSFAVYTFVKQSYRIQDFSLEQAIAIGEAQRGVETMVKELRETLPADTGAYTIESADIQSLVFYADFDKDDAIEKVRYFLVGSDFYKGVTEATGNPLEYLPENETTSIISRYVRNTSTQSIFTYYNGDWPGDKINNPLATPATPTEIRLVHVFLRINAKPQKAPTDYILESDVSLRNLKDNL